MRELVRVYSNALQIVQLHCKFLQTAAHDQEVDVAKAAEAQPWLLLPGSASSSTGDDQQVSRLTWYGALYLSESLEGIGKHCWVYEGSVAATSV